MEIEHLKELCIRVAIFRPGTDWVQFAVIPNELEALQTVVGGDIEILPISDVLDVVVNEEGKVHGLPGNRWVKGGGLFGGRDLLVGTFFVARVQDGDFCSVTEADEAVLGSWKPGFTWNIDTGEVTATPITWGKTWRLNT